eukprot:scaffold235816_cov46-Tisochrysis_lutea.AAC.3
MVLKSFLHHVLTVWPKRRHRGMVSVWRTMQGREQRMDLQIPSLTPAITARCSAASERWLKLLPSRSLTLSRGMCHARSGVKRRHRKKALFRGFHRNV